MMKLPVLQLARVSRVHWEFCCCLDRDLLPVAQICKEGGERFWAFDGFLVWFGLGKSREIPRLVPSRREKGS